MHRFTRHSLYFVFFLFCLVPVRVTAQGQRQDILVIEGGTLIDGNGGAPVPDAVIVVRGNKVESVSRKGQSSYPAGAQVLHADGKFIFPGLMDAHVHYSGFMAELLLAHGVTSVFDIGGRGLYHVVRREAIARGRIPGPRLFIAVESIVAPVRPERAVYGQEGRRVGPMTPEEARRIAKHAIDSGADLIEIRRGLSEEAFKAAVEETHKAGLPLIAQPIGPTVYAREAILAGADILEHASGVSYSIAKDPSKWEGWGDIELHSLDVRPYADMDDAKAADLIRLMVDRHVGLELDMVAEGRGLTKQRQEWELHDYSLLSDPALAYIPEGTRYKWLSNYREFDYWPPAEQERMKKGFQNYERFVGQFVRAGGKVMTGDDSSNGGWATAGIGIHHEMELMVESGLTPMQAIQAATRNPAEAYRVLPRVGTVEAGKLADLVVVNADPLQDIRNTQKIQWVIQDGKVLDRTYHASFTDPFAGDDLEAPEWVYALKQATVEGVRTIAGLSDPTWAFGQPCPGIESISPYMAKEGSPSLTVTIKGINFTSRSLAYWGERPLSTELVSETELKIKVDAGLIARAGVFPISVKNPGPFLLQPKWGTTSNRAYFLIDFK